MDERHLRQLIDAVTSLSMEVDDLRWRMSRMIGHGPVTEVDNENGFIRADIDGALTPRMQWMEPAGKSRSFTPMKKGEVITVFRPFGDGRRAFAMAGGFSGTNPKATPRGDERVNAYGGTSETMRDAEAILSTGQRLVQANAVDLGAAGGPAVARVGDLVAVGEGSSVGLWPIVTGSGVTRSI